MSARDAVDVAAAHKAAALLLAASRVDPTLRAAAERVQDALLVLGGAEPDHADAELRHRDDLARDVARLWRESKDLAATDADMRDKGRAMESALDRLADAHHTP